VQTKPLALLPIAIRKNPLVFVQDVTGFMVGSKSEQGGIIKTVQNG
jgi:acetyl-CoA carboxylase carboxyltransferase component